MNWSFLKRKSTKIIAAILILTGAFLAGNKNLPDAIKSFVTYMASVSQNPTTTQPMPR